jgi:hypothetical protein
MGVEVRAIRQPFIYKLPREGGGNGVGGFGQADEKTAIYKSHVPAMDEGWTRWMLAQEHYSFSTVQDAEIRAGRLNERYNSIVMPDQRPDTILNGYKAGAMPPEYTGGLGPASVKALREFVEQGGTLICLNRASSFAIEQFKLPLRDVVADVSEKEFFVPGSILRIELDTENPIARGMPKESIAWVEDSPVFEVVQSERGGSPNVREGSSGMLAGASVRVVARYPTDRSPLLSGWLLGEKRIRGKAALVEVTVGKGRIILFGFRPQYRGQSLATYPLLFNAINSKLQ